MERDVPAREHRGQLRDRSVPKPVPLHSSVSLSYSGKNPTLFSVGFFVGESPYFPETVEGATGADRFCLVTLTKGEATPSPLTGTQFPVLAVSPGLGCLTGRIKAFLL